ncbi:hypothetical protein T265_11312 [Opisthorchis viverrini]|uniref:Uncharacterized protein n=1 Tax=Opisthorchis viverrini TaxID=6198 RepID=A0A074YZE6_OPIVI|nr:hypothetical protein T265_11312 [Opisthorchis viverrini]KER20048.1 hypothetical protein T265_11312 [Opisthorchis viverrini]
MGTGRMSNLPISFPVANERFIARVFEISQYIFMRESTHKVAENTSTAHDRFHTSWGSPGKRSPRA